MKRRCRNIANLFAIGRAPRLASLAIAAVCALWAIGCFTINLYQGAGPDAQKAPGGAMMAAPKDNLQAPEKKPAAPESKPATPGTLKADKSVKLFMEVKPFSKKDWKYQRKITLTNNWRDLRDYTAKIIVPHRQGMSADYADLRFTEAKDKEVPYWIEEANEKSAVVWVRIPQLEAESDTMIHLHYGCEETASAGNGRAAFLFFDDFSKGFDGELWERGRDGSDGGVGADAANGAMNVWIGDGNHPDGWAKTRQQFEPPLTVESRIKLTRKGMFADN
ncbi:MAG: DUF2341 domain-containing protein, partial [Candidatus Sumerlaeota bacterium]|nr:DUF2341 domain-containing protein [Candidatus Sumerlaeota bacterium]